MLYFLLFPFILALKASARLILKDLTSQSYEIDQIMKIEWTVTPDLIDSLLTIDLVNDRPEVMIEAFLVAEEVPARLLSYSWTIPRFLKSSNEYHLRVYVKGGDVPNPGNTSYGKPFNLINLNPMRQSTLNLLEPTGSADGLNLESACLFGEQCRVSWDFPEWALTAIPRLVDIKLYSGDRLVLVIAKGISVEAKTFAWRVPDHLDSGSYPVHVVISASDKVLESVKPGQSYYLASSGYPFVLESRADREARRLNSGSITGTGGSAIQQTTTTSISGFEDVPRPTYANGNGNAKGKTGTSSSANKSSTANAMTTLVTVIVTICISFL